MCARPQKILFVVFVLLGLPTLRSIFVQPFSILSSNPALRSVAENTQNSNWAAIDCAEHVRLDCKDEEIRNSRDTSVLCSSTSKCCENVEIDEESSDRIDFQLMEAKSVFTSKSSCYLTFVYMLAKSGFPRSASRHTLTFSRISRLHPIVFKPPILYEDRFFLLRRGRCRMAAIEALESVPSRIYANKNFSGGSLFCLYTKETKSPVVANRIEPCDSSGSILHAPHSTLITVVEDPHTTAASPRVVDMEVEPAPPSELPPDDSDDAPRLHPRSTVEDILSGFNALGLRLPLRGNPRTLSWSGPAPGELRAELVARLRGLTGRCEFSNASSSATFLPPPRYSARPALVRRRPAAVGLAMLSRTLSPVAADAEARRADALAMAAGAARHAWDCDDPVVLTKRLWDLVAGLVSAGRAALQRADVASLAEMEVLQRRSRLRAAPAAMDGRRRSWHAAASARRSSCILLEEVRLPPDDLLEQADILFRKLLPALARTLAYAAEQRVGVVDVGEGYQAAAEMGCGGTAEGVGENGPFWSRRRPRIDLEAYCERIARYGGCSAGTFLVAIIYMDRYLVANPGCKVMSHTVHRMSLAALLVATKQWDDHHFHNAFWAKVGGVTTAQLNELETSFVQGLGMRMVVSDEEYTRYLDLARRLSAALALDPFPETPAPASAAPCSGASASNEAAGPSGRDATSPPPPRPLVEDPSAAESDEVFGDEGRLSVAAADEVVVSGDSQLKEELKGLDLAMLAERLRQMKDSRLLFRGAEAVAAASASRQGSGKQQAVDARDRDWEVLAPPPRRRRQSRRAAVAGPLYCAMADLLSSTSLPVPTAAPGLEVVEAAMVAGGGRARAATGRDRATSSASVPQVEVEAPPPAARRSRSKGRGFLIGVEAVAAAVAAATPANFGPRPRAARRRRRRGQGCGVEEASAAAAAAEHGAVGWIGTRFSVDRVEGLDPVPAA